MAAGELESLPALAEPTEGGGPHNAPSSLGRLKERKKPKEFGVWETRFH